MFIKRANVEILERERRCSQSVELLVFPWKDLTFHRKETVSQALLEPLDDY